MMNRENPRLTQRIIKLGNRVQWWTASVFVLAAFVCAIIAYLHFQELHTLNLAVQYLNINRRAEIDLAEGLIKISLYGNQTVPFGRSQGEAMVDQALTSLKEQMFALGQSEDALAEFTGHLDVFRDTVDNLPTGPIDNQTWVVLWSTYNHLQSHVQEQDQATLATLNVHANQLRNIFNGTLFIAVVLFSGMGFGVYRAERDRHYAERKRKESEARYRAIVEDQTELICRYDKNFRLTFVNEAYAQSYRTSPNEMIGQSFIDRIPAAERKRAIAHVQSLTARNPFATNEHPSVMPDNTLRWIQWTDRAVLDEAGNITEYQGVGRDVTARKQAEKSLVESEQRLRLFVEHAPAAIAMFDTNMNYLLVSQRWFTDYQLQETAIIGRSHYAIFPDIPERWKEVYRRCLSGAIESGEADPFPRADGRIDWVRWEVRPWYDANENIGGIFLFSEVITERIQAQHELNALYEATSALFVADDLQSIGRQIVDTVVKVFAQADCGLMLLNPSTQEISLVARAGHYDLRLKDRLQLDAAGLVAKAMRSGEIVYAPDVSVDADYVAHESHMKSELVIPLRTPKGIIGALDLQRIEVEAFSASDQRILNAFVERAALAIATMQLNESLSRYAADLEKQVRERTSELERGKASVEAILNHSPDAILLLDRDLFIQQANRQVYTIFGYSKDEIFGKSLRNFIQSDHEENLKNFVRDTRAIQNGKYLELTAIRQDGTMFDAELGVGEIHGHGLVCVVRDISQRKAYERQLQYHATLQESVSDAVFVMDMEFTLQSWNKAAEEVYGWTADEAIGTHANTILRNELSEEQHQRSFQQLLAQGWLVLDVIQHHKNGAPINIWCSMTLIKDELGHPASILSVNHDVTERKAVERQLLFNASVQANMSDAVIVTDLELHVQSWNKAAENMYGWTADEAIGQYAGEVLQTQYATAEDRQHDMAALFQHGLRQQEVIQRHKTKGAINVLTSVSLLRDNQGGAVGIVAVNHDITERKLAERQLQQRETWYRTLAQNIPLTTIFLFDRTYRYLVVEGPDTAFPPESMEGKSLQEIFSPETLLHILPGYEAALRGERMTIERVSNGRIFEGQFVPIFDADGTVSNGLLAVRDVTDERTAADKLRESEERFRRAIIDAPFPIMIHADNGEVLNISNIWTEITGYRHDEIPTIAEWTEKAYGERRESVKAIIDRVYYRTDPYRGGEFQVRTKSGDMRIWEFSAAALGSLSDGRRMVSSMAVDVTDRKQAEAALQKSEARYRALFEQSTDGVFILDFEGNHLQANRHAAEMFGYTLQEMAGFSFRDMVVPAEHGQSERVLERLLNGEHIPIYERRVRRKDGTIFPVEINVELVRAENGHPLHIQSMMRDITERKRIEDALRLSEEKFRRLIDAAPIATVVTDQTGHIRIVNQQVETLFGYERSELIGQPIETLIPEALRMPHEQHRQAFVLKPHMREMGAGMELFARRRDGSLFSTEIQLSYVQTQGGLMVMSYVTDITERKRIAAELERQRVFLREVVNSSPSMIFVKDITGRFIFVNPAMASLFATTVADLLKQSDEALSLSEKEIDGFHDADRRVITEGETISVEESLTLKTGEVRWLQTTKVPLSSEDGQSIHVLGISTDITKRKEAEIALQQALAKEKELGELKTRFVSMASHEFRTPLATILAVAETLSIYRHRLSAEKIDQRLAKIKEQVAHLQAIMEDVLTLARIQARKVEFEPSRLDLDRLCRSILEEFQERTDVTHQIEYQVNRAIPEVMMDRKLMRQVINNLVSNAIKYSPDADAVHVSLDYGESGVTLVVSDEGIGIPEADINHLFEPFHRAANVGTIPGTGLGLVIAKDAIALHGGIITVESQVGVGTTFIIRIPLTEVERGKREEAYFAD